MLNCGLGLVRCTSDCETAKKRFTPVNFGSLASSDCSAATNLPLVTSWEGFCEQICRLGQRRPTEMAFASSSSSSLGLGIIWSRSLGLFLRKCMH